METKYFNDAIIGNKKMTASFSKKGELLRLFNQAPDYKQFFEIFHTGVKVNDSALIYLHDDINNNYKQYYVENTNVLVTEIINTYFNLKTTQIDFVLTKENVLVRRYHFKNNNSIDLNLHFLIYSKLFTNINNDACGYINNDALLQYTHDYTVCTFAKEKISSYQINNVSENFIDGSIGGKDYIGMSSDSGIEYDLGILKPGEEKIFSVYININDNSEKNMMNELDSEIERFRKIDLKKELENTKKYWRKYLKDHSKIEFKENNSNLEKIYNRTILLFPLLINDTTGGISAGIESDEYKTKCGRYSYCWPRDAIFVTEAFDDIGMEKESDKFYKTFCKMTQSKNGGWEQRFYTDGRLAPCWGYQIDETASVIYGVYKHYLRTKNIKFLKDTLKMVENGIDYLEKYVEDILTEKFEFRKSYDLWEEFEGITLYSLSAIFGAYNSMLEIYKEVKSEFANNRLRIEAMEKRRKVVEKRVRELKEYVLKHFYDDNRKCFVRNMVDKRLDISLLGSVFPFNMFTAKEKKILNTIENMNMTLRTYTGGYIRYEGDTYNGGYNPWVIANLWMVNYYLDAGEKNKAIECFEFVVKSSSEHGFLGEQVNNETMKPSWIIGLTWSHAMFISVVSRLNKLGLI